jgi:hypothetical protein
MFGPHDFYLIICFFVASFFNFSPNVNLYSCIKFTENANNSNSISAICEDEQNNLWIATDGSGLLKLNKTRKNQQCINY